MKRNGKLLLVAVLLLTALALTGCSVGGKLSVEAFRSAQKVDVCEEGTFIVTLSSGKMCVIDTQGHILVPAKWDYIDRAYIPGMYRVANEDPDTGDQVWGAVDSAGKVIIPAEWDMIVGYTGTPDYWEAEPDSKKDPNRQTVYFSKDGKRINADEISSDIPYRNVFISEQNGKYGILSDTGAVIVPYKYDKLRYDSGGGLSSFAVSLNGKWGMIDLNGQEIVPCTYRDIYVWRGQVWALTNTNEVVRMDEHGQVLFSLTDSVASMNRIIRSDKLEFSVYWDTATGTRPHYVDEQISSDSLMLYSTRSSPKRLAGLVGMLILPDGTLVFPGFADGYTMSKYVSPGASGEYIASFNRITWNSSGTRFEVSYDKSYRAVINTVGGYIIRPGKYQDITWSARLGVYICRGTNGLYALHGPEGATVVSAYYDYIGYRLSSEDGLLVVKKNGLYGYIDRAGNVVLPVKWKNANVFNEGYAAVKDDEGWKIIDVTGNVVY